MKTIENLTTSEINEEIQSLEGDLEIPSKKLRNKLARYISNADSENPLKIYVGSCPDYNHSGGIYDYSGIRSGVPLLTTAHLHSSRGFLQLLDTLSVPYEYTIMVADVEAEDEIFAEKFTGGDQVEFRHLCLASMHSTQRALDGLDYSGKLRSSSFFEEFGRDSFMGLQKQYQQVLTQALSESENGSFSMRLLDDLRARRGMYNSMYQGFIEEMSTEQRNQFFIERTIRTMAQYLTLGRLINDNARYPVIVNHQTRNTHVFNERGKFPLSIDDGHEQEKIPTFKIRTAVY